MNYNVLQTTPQGVNVSVVTTSNRLLISGISTFTGLVDANGGAHIDNLRLGKLMLIMISLHLLVI